MSSRTRHAWTYLGLAIAPTVITALPTAATPTVGGMRVRNIEVRYPAGEARNGTAPLQPPGVIDGSDSDDESDGEDSDGAESDDEDAAASGSVSAGLPLPTPVPESDTASQTRIQSAEEETKEHWVIAMGSVASFVVICALCFLLWKWRAAIARKIFPRRGDRNSFSPPPEKSPPANSGSTDGWRPVGSDDDAASTHRSFLFGAPMTATGDTEHGRLDMPHPPAAAQMGRQESLLDRSARQRMPTQMAATLDGYSNTIPPQREAVGRRSMPTRKTKRESLTIAPPAATAFPPAPAIPDSPETAREISRFSWTTAAGKSVRSSESLESQPVRHRTVDSWVSHQAHRAARNTEAPQASTPPTPTTPVEFRAHPGAEVEFGNSGRRIESRVLDLRLDSRS